MKIGFRGVPKRNRPWISRSKLFVSLKRFQRLSTYLDEMGIYIYGFPRRFFPERKKKGNTIPDVSDFAGLDTAISAFTDMFNKRGIEILFYIPRYCGFDNRDHVVDATIDLLDVYGVISDKFDDAHIVIPFESCEDNEECIEKFDEMYERLGSSAKRSLVCKNDGCDLDLLRMVYHKYKMPIYLDVEEVRKQGIDIGSDIIEMLMKSWDNEMIMEYGSSHDDLNPDDFWKTFDKFSRYVSVVIDDTRKEKAVEDVVEAYEGIM